MSTNGHARPQTVGPDSGPEAPFPLRLSGKVIKGFGRGSKELGIPTANIPISGLAVGGHEGLESGVYYGWVGLESLEHLAATSNPGSKRNSGTGKVGATGEKVSEGVQLLSFGHGPTGQLGAEPFVLGQSKAGEIYPMVMSVGWNPYYKNTVRSVEVHIIHPFKRDFYGTHLNLLMLGFIRPEINYTSKEALIDDIKTDIDVTNKSLARPAYARYKEEQHLLDFSEVSDADV